VTFPREAFTEGRGTPLNIVLVTGRFEQKQLVLIVEPGPEKIGLQLRLSRSWIGPSGIQAKAWLRGSRKRFETSGDPDVRIHPAKISVELDPCAARYRSETLKVPRHYVGEFLG
jgi:hypothetical protein